MTTIQKSQASSPGINFDLNTWINEHITRNWFITIWVTLITLFTIQFTRSRLEEAFLSTLVVLIVWAISVALTIYSEVLHKHTAVTLWLRNNMYNSITNVELTLIIVLAIIAAVMGLFSYALRTASFVTTPATDIRAAFVSADGNNYCFNVGSIDPDLGAESFAVREQNCFSASAIDTEATRSDLTAVSIGEEAANICFDTDKANPENGLTCFESVAGDPTFFAVTREFSGANWGAVGANLTTLMVFRFDREQIWRVWAAGSFGLFLAIASFVVYRDNFQNKRIRQALTYTWLASPIIFYILLAGVPPVEGSFISNFIPYAVTLIVAAGLWYANKYINTKYPPQKGESEQLRLGRILSTMLVGIFAFLGFLSVLGIIVLIFGVIKVGGEQVFVAVDPDVDWGGFLLTLIITAFAIVVSFPLGVILALGRRSTIRGIPGWITYPVALIIMAWGLINSTPTLVTDARNNFELVVAYWPLIMPVIAWVFQRVWKGNVVSGFCTLYIEFIRGIPLITVLFLAIILFPILLPPNTEVLNVWRVMFAFTFFSAAYLAENVRGGLQAIPNGQYEAADSIGLSTFNKYRLIILPQALRTVIPAITNQYIGLFKDTTLVAIVGLLDILGVANAISAQPQWLGVRREAYIYIALLYFIISAAIAAYSARLEKQSGLGER